MDAPENARSGEIATIFDRLFPLWGVCALPAKAASALRSRGNPLPEGAKSVLVAAFPYLLPEEMYAGRNIARFAVARDYHAVCGARLARGCHILEGMHPGAAFAWHCDNSPLPEVALAEAAGLGRKGRHNLLITRPYGSWVFLGEIVSTVALPRNPRNALPEDHLACASCRRCEAACPTGALAEGAFDRGRCLSLLSQRKGALTGEEEAMLRRGESAWGCDICQEACPLNAGITPAPLPEFLADPLARLGRDTPLEGRAYAWRGRAVLERNLEVLDGRK